MLVSPLSVSKTKSSKFILNLNTYRNTHYQTLNNVKKNYKQWMSSQIENLPFIDVPVSITFTLFPKSKRRTDLTNVLSIHDKFFCDALVELGKLEDDDYYWIPEVIYKFGCVDKENPRVEILIIEY